MNKRFFFLTAWLFLLASPAICPAVYQGGYAVVIEGPTTVDLNSTEQFVARAYDPQGNPVSEVTFTRTFSSLGLTTVNRQMTVYAPDGTKHVLNGSLDVAVQNPEAAGGDTEAAPPPEGVFFTDPAKSSSGVTNATVDVIRSAKSEILIAAYTIESQDVVDALVEAANRLGAGNVKVVIEEKYFSDPDNQAVLDALTAAGVQIVSDGTRSGSLMHNKFVVVDDKTVLTGSTNFTTTQLTSDANNTVIFRDPDMAAAYATEFKEMFSGNFDGGKQDNTQHEFTVEMGGGGGLNINTASAQELAGLPGIGSSMAQKIVSFRETNGPFQSVQDLDRVPGIGSSTVAKVSPYVTTEGGEARQVQVEVYFTPSDQTKDQLIKAIDGARQSIDFSIFTFTDPDVADALQAAKERGVQVRGVFDAWQANGAASQFDDLQSAGLEVKKDGFSALNHSKYLVADGSVVVTGSYNWTGAANGENDENLLIIRDAQIASQYLANFSSAFAAGK